MTTIATGGFSTRDGSIGAFANSTAEIIITCFMFFDALPFVLYLQAIRGRPFLLWRDQQVRWFLIVRFILSVTSAHCANNDIGLETGIKESSLQCHVDHDRDRLCLCQLRGLGALLLQASSFLSCSWVAALVQRRAPLRFFAIRSYTRPLKFK